MRILAQKKILITRDISQSGSLRRILEENGAEVLSVPTIKIGDPPDWTAFDGAAGQIGSFDWIIFTSVNAVRKTSERCRALSLALAENPHLKIASVGDQTSREIETAGWNVDLVPRLYQAEGLLAALLKVGVSGKKIWFPRALKARETLISELESAGATVRMTPVYQNEIPYENRERLIQVLEIQQIDWITFTSSSTVTNFFKILGRTLTQEQMPKLASIGSVTSRTLRDHGLQPEITANPQNLAGLCQGILDWQASRL